jgi:hypothetical protein
MLLTPGVAGLCSCVLQPAILIGGAVAIVVEESVGGSGSETKLRKPNGAHLEQQWGTPPHNRPPATRQMVISVAKIWIQGNWAVQ